MNRVDFRLIASRCRDPNVGAELGAGEHQRVRDVIAVPNEGDLESGDFAFEFEDLGLHEVKGVGALRIYSPISES